jgi:hypothetical protein
MGARRSTWVGFGPVGRRPRGMGGVRRRRRRGWLVFAGGVLHPATAMVAATRTAAMVRSAGMHCALASSARRVSRRIRRRRRRSRPRRHPSPRGSAQWVRRVGTSTDTDRGPRAGRVGHRTLGRWWFAEQPLGDEPGWSHGDSPRTARPSTGPRTSAWPGLVTHWRRPSIAASAKRPRPGRLHGTSGPGCGLWPRPGRQGMLGLGPPPCGRRHGESVR